MYDEDLLREVDGPDHKRKQVRRLLMHLQIRTEDFLDVATSARLSVRGPDVFPRTGTSYWLLLLSLLLRVWIDWCDDWLVRPSQYATRLLCGWLYSAYLYNYVCRPPTVSALVLCARSCTRVGTDG